MRPALVLAALLLALVPLPADGAMTADCLRRVPCGYIYPRLLLEAPDWPAEPPLLPASGLRVEARIVYEFDPMAEGLALDQPGEPIVVTFEFPKKPEWAAIRVEPEEIPIPIQPQYFRPDPADPADPQMTYRYEADVTIHLGMGAAPVLPTGQDVARLLVFAKSTESGLYKPGYGIREFKVRPEGLTHADAAAAQTLEPVDAMPVAARDLDVAVAPGVTARLDLPDRIEFFRVTPVRLDLEGAAGPVAVALLDEGGAVLALAGPHAAPFAFNVTFPRAGAYRFAVVLPGAGGGPAAGSADLDLPGPGDGRAHRMPRDYRLLVDGAFTTVAANAGDPAAQDERLVPFPVFDGASSAEVALALATPGLAVDRGAANVNLQVLDPTGAVLQTGTVDPANPAKRFHVGALPGPGLYAVRVFGTGVSPASAWRLAVQVVYDEKPLLTPEDAPWRGDVARLGALNATLDGATEGAAAGAVAPWTPAPFRLAPTRQDGTTPEGAARAAFLALDDAGRLVAATGLLEADAGALAGDVVFPEPGRYTVLAWAESVPGSAAQWGRGLVARTVLVGDAAAPTVTYPVTYAAGAAGIVEPGATFRVGAWRVPIHPGAGAIQIALDTSAPAEFEILLHDDAGREVARVAVPPTAPGPATAEIAAPQGTHVLSILARAAAGAAVTSAVEIAYAGPIVAANPLHVPVEGAPPAGFFLPGPPIAVLLAAVAAAGAGWRRSFRRDEV